MQFIPTSIEGVMYLAFEPRSDERGSFGRAWCAQEFEDLGLAPAVSQINISTNIHAGTIRGLHFQQGAHAEAKTFRCIRGRTFHVAVDLRPASPTFGQWVGRKLSAERFDAFHIPVGCAAGYQALEDDATVLYLASTPYAPGVEGGYRFDDPTFAIDWPLSHAIVSDKDRSWPDFSHVAAPSLT